MDVATEGRTLMITIDRGEGNRFTSEMIRALPQAVAAARVGTSFVHIRAQGPAFCLGRERPSGSAGELREESRRVVELFEALRATPLIVITEVQGDASGLGAGIVDASDVVLAADSAQFRFPEIDVGYAPTVVISWARFTLGPKRAFQMAVTGEPIDAKTAFAFGLVTEVVPRERVETRGAEWLAGLEDRDPGTLRDVKMFFVQTRSLDPVSAAMASVDALTLAMLGLDANEEIPSDEPSVGRSTRTRV
jgi:methylglutaconyl-CoA hydratase